MCTVLLSQHSPLGYSLSDFTFGNPSASKQRLSRQEEDVKAHVVAVCHAFMLRKCYQSSPTLSMSILKKVSVTCWSITNELSIQDVLQSP